MEVLHQQFLNMKIQFQTEPLELKSKQTNVEKELEDIVLTKMKKDITIKKK